MAKKKSTKRKTSATKSGRSTSSTATSQARKKTAPANKRPAKTRPIRKKADTDKCDFPIVGVGASPGGLEALEELFGSMPAIMVVGHAPPAVLSRWTGVPRSSCFQKPVGMESLLDRVGLVIARSDLRRNGEPLLDSERLVRPAEAENVLA